MTKLCLLQVNLWVITAPGLYSRCPTMLLCGWQHYEHILIRRDHFSDYALLGDDIVIADRSVAKEYRSLLDALQVDISDAKSIVSETGCLEFAKRFWVKIMSKDLSPVSAKAVLESYFLVGTQQLAYKYKLSPKTCLRLNKAGYRVLGQMDTKALSRRF